MDLSRESEARTEFSPEFRRELIEGLWGSGALPFVAKALSSPWRRMKLAMRTVDLDDELATLLEQEKPLDQAARETLVMDLFSPRKDLDGEGL